MRTSILALALAIALPARAEDPKPATPAAPTVVAPPLPASAFQAANVLLGKLKDLDPRGERLALASLESARVAPRGERAESVTIEIELTLAASALETSRAALAEWTETLKKETALVGLRSSPGDAGARQVRVHVDWDPSKSPPRATKEAGTSTATDSTSYIFKSAAMDKVEVGYTQQTSTTRRVPGTDWIEERWTIRSKDPARTLPRIPIQNFATVLERDHPYASVTRFSMLAASEPCAEYRMDLELTLLRPARAGELDAAPGKR